MAFKFCVASTSDCPPDRKVTPGTAAGTLRRNAVTVANPTSAGEALVGYAWPGNLIKQLMKPFYLNETFSGIFLIFQIL